MGWTVLLVVEPVRAALPPESWALLLSGGLVYTGGAVFYLLPKAKWAHPLWHVFVLAGSILHFLSVYRCA
jgi:hemolysin III